MPITCHRIDLLAAAIVRAGSVSTKGLENTLTSRYTLPMARDSSKTRLRLIAAADGLFYGQGIRAVGVDAVAEAAGVTKRTLYYHFASKDDLIAAYLEERDLPTLGRYQGMISEGRAPAARRIRRIFEQLGKNAEDPRWRGCSFLRAAAEFANLPGHPARVVAARHKRRFEAWLEEVLAADGFGEAAALARQLMILLDGAVAQILIHREPSYALSAADAASTLLKRTNESKKRRRAQPSTTMTEGS
jgi:AcrR family transcriptional regulator